MKTRGLRGGFCPNCGRETAELFEGLCKECLAARIRDEIFHCFRRSPHLELKYCKICDSFFKGKERVIFENAVEEFAERIIKRCFGDKNAKLKAEIEEIKSEKGKICVFLKMNLDVKGVEVSAEFPLNVSLRRELCEDCSKMVGGYYAAIVQLRAEGREPSDYEIERAREIARFSLSSKDFITKEEKVRGGIDFYVSSSAYARRISREIVKNLGGYFSESPELYGIKNGKRMYRVSFSVRLPPEEREERSK